MWLLFSLTLPLSFVFLYLHRPLFSLSFSYAFFDCFSLPPACVIHISAKKTVIIFRLIFVFIRMSYMSFQPSTLHPYPCAIMYRKTIRKKRLLFLRQKQKCLEWKIPHIWKNKRSKLSTVLVLWVCISFYGFIYIYYFYVYNFPDTAFKHFLECKKKTTQKKYISSFFGLFIWFVQPFSKERIVAILFLFEVRIAHKRLHTYLHNKNIEKAKNNTKNGESTTKKNMSATDCNQNKMKNNMSNGRESYTTTRKSISFSLLLANAL